MKLEIVVSVLCLSSISVSEIQIEEAHNGHTSIEVGAVSVSGTNDSD